MVWNLKGINDMPKVTQLICSKARIWNPVYPTPEPLLTATVLSYNILYFTWRNLLVAHLSWWTRLTNGLINYIFFWQGWWFLPTKPYMVSFGPKAKMGQVRGWFMENICNMGAFLLRKAFVRGWKFSISVLKKFHYSSGDKINTTIITT